MQFGRPQIQLDLHFPLPKARRTCSSCVHRSRRALRLENWTSQSVARLQNPAVRREDSRLTPQFNLREKEEKVTCYHSRLRLPHTPSQHTSESPAPQRAQTSSAETRPTCPDRRPTQMRENIPPRRPAKPLDHVAMRSPCY